jgi:protein farnesyltransferase/geranylgeranyltransferase type-1 subunit alpha
MPIKRITMFGVIGLSVEEEIDKRQWLVKRFELSPETEIAFTDRLIEADILNNSAWSHRFYCLFTLGDSKETKDQVIESELDNVKQIIRKLSSNATAWNYLRGWALGTL